MGLEVVRVGAIGAGGGLYRGTIWGSYGDKRGKLLGALDLYDSRMLYDERRRIGRLRGVMGDG